MSDSAYFIECTLVDGQRKRFFLKPGQTRGLCNEAAAWAMEMEMKGNNNSCSDSSTEASSKMATNTSTDASIKQAPTPAPTPAPTHSYLMSLD